MTGITELEILMRSMSPALQNGEFVFCTIPGAAGCPPGLAPVATFLEPEGITLVVHKDDAEHAGMQFDGIFRQITLRVYSSLAAVGLTAAVAGVLAEQGISANVIAAYHHDHVFVPANRAEDALQALQELSQQYE